MRYNKNTKKVSPLAGKIYKECEESDMTVGEFLLLAEVLRNIHRRLVQVNNERKLNEYCNKVIVDALNQSSEKLEQWHKNKAHKDTKYSRSKNDKEVEMQKDINNRVSLPEAAKELGMSQQAVREHMKRKVIDIGYVLPGIEGKRKNYLIYRDKLDKFLGKAQSWNVDAEL